MLIKFILLTIKQLTSTRLVAMRRGKHVVYQCPYCDNFKGIRTRVVTHIAKVHEEEHRRCEKCPVLAPKTAGDQAAVSSSQSKRRKVDAGA